MGLKIFMAVKDREDDLVEEMQMSGFDPIPFKYGERRRLRKANKWVIVQRWAIKGMVFCECDVIASRWKWVRSVWCRDDKYVEIDRSEIEHLLDDIKLPKRVGVPYSVGDEYVIPDGPFIGCTMIIRSVSHTRYRGWIDFGDGRRVPMDVPRSITDARRRI